MPRYNNSIVQFLNFYTHFLKFCRNGLQMLGYDIVDSEHTLCGSSRNHKSTGLDHIGNNSVSTAVKLVYPFYFYHVCTGPGNSGAACIQKVCKVHNMRLSRSIFNDRHPLGADRRHHDIHRRANRHNVEIYLISIQPTRRSRFNSAVFHIDRSTQSFKTLDMLINRSDAKITSAGETRTSATKAPQFSPQHIIRSPHFSHQRVRSASADRMFRIDFHCIAVEPSDFRSHTAEYFQRQRYIADIRYVFKDTSVIY